MAGKLIRREMITENQANYVTKIASSSLLFDEASGLWTVCGHVVKTEWLPTNVFGSIGAYCVNCYHAAY